jgi:hypothetical protein
VEQAVTLDELEKVANEIKDALMTRLERTAAVEHLKIMEALARGVWPSMIPEPSEERIVRCIKELFGESWHDRNRSRRS